MHKDDQITGTLFVGRWIGETQGREMPAHIWEIVPHGTRLEVRNCWEGEAAFRVFHAEIVLNERAFTLPGYAVEFKATLIDKQHFVIPNWCDGTGGEGPYDVVFSRPGIAELTTKEAYKRFIQEDKDPAD